MDRLLRLAKVKEVTGLGKTTVYELMAEGRFPRPYQLGRQAVGWKSSEVQAWD